MSGRHVAPRAVTRRRRPGRRAMQGTGAALTTTILVAALSGASAASSSSTSASYTDVAGGQFHVAAGEWCPAVVSTEDGPVVFEKATGFPTEHVHVMCSPSDTYRSYWQSDVNFV
ncbi:MAG: hypothetical protein HGA44_22365, partial [Cellulomonadaceae bacterium]|nr:hypothetical protein [Cellulomonadaceae bacterium]